MTEFGVVVPAVAPSGDLVESPVVVDAQAEPGVIVADQVTPADRVESEVVEGSFQTLGVTWPKDVDAAGLGTQVRTRADGTWSPWVPLEEAEASLDPGSADAANGARGGTDSLWVGESDAVQLSFAGTPGGGPEGLSLALVDVPAAPVGASAPASEVSSSGKASIRAASYISGAVQTAAAAPHVISRAEWGARSPACQPDVAGTLVGAVVHHTADSNDYWTVADAMSKIRGDQAYHIDSQHWCDIGYNFLVDKWGNIYEGRANSMTSAVIGVHASGFNTGVLGVSMLGTYEAAPSFATQSAVAQIIGWRLGEYGIDPRGSTVFPSGGGVRPRVLGHRDVAATACPGNGGYSALGWIRSRAASYAYSGPLVSALYSDMLGRGVDQGGLSTWTSALSNGTSAGQLAGSLAVSQEYATAEVRRAYVDMLRRQPDDGGLVNWTNAVMGGLLRPEDLRGALIASQEYYNNAGGTDAAYIAALYRDILLRNPQGGEVSSWLSVIASTGRGTVSHGVWKSMESARIRVDEAYHQYLGRSADQVGLGGWAPVLQARGEGALRSAIVDSDEYMQRAFARF